MTKTVDCPACSSEITVEIEKLEGDPISVDCETCHASLKVAYKVAEVDTDITVDKAPPVSFQCPHCGADNEVEEPDEIGSDEFGCQVCLADFEVSWSDWGQTVDDTRALK
jgi:transcription elongation factor Elf1